MSASSVINESREKVYSTDSELSSQADAPAKRHPRRVFSCVLYWLFFFSMVMAFFEFAPIAIAFANSRQNKQSIEKKILGADRVLIENGFTPPRDELVDAVEIQGVEVVAEIMSLIEVHEKPQTLWPFAREFWVRVDTECMCLDDFQIEFRQGNIRLARFGLNPGPELSVSVDRRHLGIRYKLTDRSYSALLAWLEQKSPPPEKKNEL